MTVMPRILIAEDEEALCAMCARALTMDGHEVKTAADGSEALDLLTRQEGAFDLLPVSYTHLDVYKRQAPT